MKKRELKERVKREYRVCHGFRLMNREDYFESILITFKSSVSFRGRWGSSINLLKTKIKPPYVNLARTKSVECSVEIINKKIITLKIVNNF